MADKKSWRDYLDSVKTGTSKNSEESGTWRDYLANRSSSSNTSSSSNSSGGSGGWRDQIRPSVTNAIGNEISSRVNAWLDGHNSYVTDYQNRYAGRKYSYEDAFVNDSGRWLDSVSEQMDKYEAERQEILSYMDQYSSYLDADWVKSVQDTLAKGREAQLQIRSVARNDFDWWNSFNNEELVQKYGSAEDAYKYYQRSDGYSKKYAGQTYDQLTEILKGMEDGEEKEWLGSYASQVDYDEKSKFDLEAGAREIEDLEAQKEALIREFEAMDVVTGTPEGNKLNNEFLRNMEEFDKQISQKKAYLTLAKRVQEGIRLASVADKESGNYDPEFDQHSGYVSTQSGEWHSGLTSQLGMGYDDLTYEYINGKDNGMRSEIIGEAVARDYDTDDYFIYDHMTDSQIAIYNYYYSKHGKEAADNYLDSIRGSLNYQEAADRFGKMKGKTALEFIFGIEAGVDQFQSGIKNLFSSADYIPTSSTQYLSGLVREDLKDNGPKLPGWMGGASLGQGAYDIITTTSNMAPSILTSTVVGAFNPAAGAAVGNALMGASAAGSAYQEALNLGYDKGQARTYSTLVGASEVGLQYLLGGIGKLGGSLSGKAAASLASKFDNAYIRLAVKYGTNMISEGAEEYLQEVLTPMFKNFALSTDEEVNLISEDAIYSFLLGALSSGFMEGTGISSDNGKGLIGNLIDMSSNNKANIEAATLYGDTEVQKALIKEGLASDVGSESHQLAEMFKRKTDKGKSMTGYEIRQQVEANEAQFVVENYEEALPLAKQRLTELGETKDVDKIAELVAKRASGQVLTPAEKSALVRSQYGSKVAKEMTPSNDPNQTYKPLESRVGTESSFGVSESGQATIQESGEAFDIKKAEVVAFTTDEATGKITDVTFKTEDGTEVQASGIDFADSDQSYLVEAVSKIENITPAAATVAVHSYDPSTGQTVGEYLNGFDEAYTYGYNKYPEADLKAGNFTHKLTNEQMMTAYQLGKSAKKISSENKAQGIKRMRTASQAAVEKAIAEGKAAPNTNGLTITYNKGGGNVVSVDEANAKDAQTGGIEVAKILHKLGLGTRVELFSSYITKDEHGNKIRVFRDDNGVEQKAYSGVYRKSDGTIRIDLNAYNGKGLTLYALSHELTHFIQQWSTEKYEVLADFLVKTYEGTDMTMHDRVVKEQDRLKRIRRKEVSYSEAYDEVVANAMSKMFDDGKLVEKLAKLKEQDKTLAQKLWEGFKQIMSKFMGFYQNESLFQDADVLVDMKETFEKLQDMFAEALVEASDNFQASQQIGLEIDTATESVSPAVMHSEHTWTESDYVQERDKAAKEIAKAIGVTEKKAKDYIDSINSIAKMIAEDRSRLDYFSSPGRTSFVGNVEYGGSFDFSTLCKKRRLLTGTFTAIQKALPNTALTANEILDIRNRMKKANLEVSCGLCYVEGSRANMGQFAKEFLRLYKQYYPDAWQPNMADVNTPDGVEWMRINHPEAYEQYEYFWNHYGTLKEGDKNLFASQQKPKLYQLHTEYKGEILQKFKGDDNVEEKNLNGGIRLQSFSDFEIVHLIDTMQIIMDMSRVGLSGQAYTKVPDFAWALGDTGLKINLSLIAKGVDADGKLIFDDVEGMPIAEAMKLRDRYSKNVGTILVAFNDEQLLAAMADDRVDFIIPFHRSQWKKSQYEAMGLPAKTKDYTFMQNEKYIKPQFHEYRGRMVKDKATNYMPNEYWDFSKSGKENAEAYLEMCARNNKRPKFYKLLQNNGDGSYSLKADGSTDGYWKLLIDFKMYDNDGNGSPQMPVKPEFNMEEANRMLDDYKGGHSNFPVAQGIVDSFVKDYKASHKGEQYSEHETDRQQYNAFREKFAKERLDSLSDKLGALFPLSAGFEQAIQNDKTKVSNMTIVANSLKRGNGESFYTAAKNAFKKVYGGKTTFSIKQIGITADADDSFARESISKAGHASDKQTLLDLTPAYKQLIEESRLLAVERTIHNDNKKTSLLCYRLYNAYIRKEAYIDASGIKQTHDVPHIVVFNVVQNLNDAKAHMVTDIKDVAVRNGHNSSKLKYATHANGNISISNIAEVYDVVKSVDRKNGGLRYSAEDERVYKFGYTQKNSGEMYSEHETDYSNRSLLANAFETITNGSEEYKLIQKYKGYIAELNSLENKLSDMNAQIRKIRFTKGEYDAEKLARLEGEAEKIRDAINKYDQYLLSLEASEPLRKVIERERKKEAKKTKEHVKEIQENKKVKAEQTELRHKIRKAVRDLDKILKRGNKQKNVKEDLQPVVTKALKAADILFTEHYGNYDMLRNGIEADMSDDEEALVATCARMLKDIDKMPTDGYENFMARQEAEKKLSAKMSKLKDVFARERKRLNNTTVSSILGDLADAYATLENSKQSYVQGAYNEAVHNFLKNLQSEVGGTVVQDMTKNQLENVYAAYQMVLTTVRKANQLFNQELKMSREQLANAVIQEVIKAGGVHLLGTKLGDAISQFGWNNTKPVWVANRIGSESFAKLMQGLFEGQYNFAVDIEEAKQFKLEMDKKYKPRNWDAEKLYEFESSTGKKFSLNLQQIMSLYAFSKREQAYSHLLNGGFVFEENSTVIVEKNGIKRTYIHKGAASYKLNEAALDGIINTLTAEQKAYVDEMQKYLSETMGAKGNEVSMQLYGIKMFKEQFYFPLRSSGAYMERAKEAEMKKQQGQINLVNSGFTHAVKPQAANPIILSGFMDVWAEHCNEMSMYHSMVLPMEDFRKVYNYSTPHEEGAESYGVYAAIKNAYGNAATAYIDQLYKELNAGATVDPRETPWKKLISHFKKSAVMLSASVWIQQFSSIGRAYALIDPKHFTGQKVNSDTKLSAAEEMKKYAPVAIIKEMGGFDTGTKGSAKSYIMAEKYGKGEHLKGLLKDEQYRSDIMGYMPTKADEKTWVTIWEAVKRETKAKHPNMDVKSEEFLKLAGARFSEVIEKTQVYDSVLARSANMRSKGNFMSMATAFMAEPTTTINLIENAIRSGNKVQIARTFGAVAVSILLNNALASIVYAMRDDDEDETFLEKYFQSFTSGLIDDINPMSYYPFLKDIYSTLQGYDVERTDMAVFSDFRDALKQVLEYTSEDTSDMDDDALVEHNKRLWGAYGSLLDAVFSAFGVPVKNVRRDGLAIVNGIKTVSKDLSNERDNSWLSFWDKVGAAVKDTIPVYAWTKDKAKTDMLYEAIVSGDNAYLGRLKSTYKTEDAYSTAVRKALRENDPRIREAALAHINGDPSERVRIAKLIKADGFNQDDVVMAINAEINELTKSEGDSGTTKVKGLYKAEDFVREYANGDMAALDTIREDILDTAQKNGKSQKDAEKEFVSSVKSSAQEAYLAGLLDDARAKEMIMEYTDMDEEEVASRVDYWAFCKDNPKYADSLNESNVNKYKEFAEPAEIPLDVYVQYVEGTKGLETIKDEWGDEVMSVRDQVLEVIDSLPLTWQQKDALYLAHGYSENTIWDVPW